MAFLLAAALSAASFLLVLARVPARAEGRPARSQNIACELEPVRLSPGEQIAIEAGRVVVREIRDARAKGRTFEAVGTFAAAAADVLRIVTDFRHYDEFMPRVARIAVTEESPAVFLVEQHLKLPLGVHRRYRLRYTVRQAAEGFRIDWVKVPWPEVPLSHSVVDTSGHWQVGLFGEGRLLAVYRVFTDPGKVPLGMTGLALSLSKRELPKVIERVRRRLLGVNGRPPDDD
jgi:hypothetical protein